MERKPATRVEGQNGAALGFSGRLAVRAGVAAAVGKGSGGGMKRGVGGSAEAAHGSAGYG